eukprot:4729449-Amphidinium_carterae.1
MIGEWHTVPLVTTWTCCSGTLVALALAGSRKDPGHRGHTCVGGGRHELHGYQFSASGVWRQPI